MLVYDRHAGTRAHLRVRDLPALLRRGDLLVCNDTRVLPWRLLGRRPGGGRVEALVLDCRGGECVGFLRPLKRLRPGQKIELEDGAVVLTVGERLSGGRARFWLRAPRGDLEDVLERVGRAPLPPYLPRSADEDREADRRRYQTVYARRPGAVAAPTAGLHFTEELLENLAARGVEVAFVTLHVGPGTFAPVRVERVVDHRMEAERYVLPEETAAAVRRARSRGGRVVAVGTTTVRVLETCARPDRTVSAGRGETELFLYPGKPIRVVDALMTNFHLPGSTLLMLVSAFAGRERVLELYREAIERGYRFYSFGDAMLIL